MVLNRADNVLLFKMFLSEVHSRLPLELTRICSLAPGHFMRVDNCHIGGLNLDPQLKDLACH